MNLMQKIAVVMVMSTTAAFAQAELKEDVTSFPKVSAQVYEYVVPKLPKDLKNDLAALKQEEPEFYNEVIWELYDIAEAYRYNRIELGADIAELNLRYDLLDLEAMNQAELYLEAQAERSQPAVAEYEKLEALITEMFDLEEQIVTAEVAKQLPKLSASQRQELQQLEADRRAMRDELIQRTIDEYLSEDEHQAYDA